MALSRRRWQSGRIPWIKENDQEGIMFAYEVFEE